MITRPTAARARRRGGFALLLGSQVCGMQLLRYYPADRDPDLRGGTRSQALATATPKAV